MRGALDRGGARMAMGGVDEDDEEGPPPSQYFTLPVKFYSRRASFAIPSQEGSGVYYVDAPLVRKGLHHYIRLVGADRAILVPAKDSIPLVNVGRPRIIRFVPDAYQMWGATVGVVAYMSNWDWYALMLKTEYDPKTRKFFVWARPNSPDAQPERVSLRKLVGRRYLIDVASVESPKSRSRKEWGEIIMGIMGIIGVFSLGFIIWGPVSAAIMGIPGGMETMLETTVPYLATIMAGLGLYLSGKMARAKAPVLRENYGYREPVEGAWEAASTTAAGVTGHNMYG
jgi:hypothetical protein